MAFLSWLRRAESIWHLCFLSLFTLLAGLSGYSGEFYTKLLDNLTINQELRTQAFLQPGQRQTALVVEALARQLRLTDRDPEASLSLTLLQDGKARFQIEDAFMFGHVIMQTQNAESRSIILSGVGSYVAIVVYMPQSGCYQIKVFAQNGQPPPVEIGVSYGSFYLGVEKLVFDLGDNSWSDKSANLWALKGRTTIEMIFLNDYYDPVTGVDRNAWIDWVEISEMPRNACSAR